MLLLSENQSDINAVVLNSENIETLGENVNPNNHPPTATVASRIAAEGISSQLHPQLL